MKKIEIKVIRGLPGSGKTTLLRSIEHNYEAVFDSVYGNYPHRIKALRNAVALCMTPLLVTDIALCDDKRYKAFIEWIDSLKILFNRDIHITLESFSNAPEQCKVNCKARAAHDHAKECERIDEFSKNYAPGSSGEPVHPVYGSKVADQFAKRRCSWIEVNGVWHLSPLDPFIPSVGRVWEHEGSYRFETGAKKGSGGLTFDDCVEHVHKLNPDCILVGARPTVPEKRLAKWILVEGNVWHLMLVNNSTTFTSLGHVAQQTDGKFSWISGAAHRGSHFREFDTCVDRVQQYNDDCVIVGERPKFTPPDPFAPGSEVFYARLARNRTNADYTAEILPVLVKKRIQFNGVKYIRCESPSGNEWNLKKENLCQTRKGAEDILRGRALKLIDQVRAAVNEVL